MNSRIIIFFIGVIISIVSHLACLQSYSARVVGRNDFDAGNPDSLVQMRLAREIRKFVGTAYQYGGLNHEGTDCSGLVFTIFKNALGLELPRITKDLARVGRSIQPGALRLGDLVFFHTQRSRGIDHVGIYLENGQFVHSSASKGVVISSLNDAYYANRLIMARRVVNGSVPAQ